MEILPQEDEVGAVAKGLQVVRDLGRRLLLLVGNPAVSAHSEMIIKAFVKWKRRQVDDGDE